LKNPPKRGQRTPNGWLAAPAMESSRAVVPREMILLILVSGFLLLYGLGSGIGGDQLAL